MNSSWNVRVDRDELLQIQVDGTHGTAVAGLRECKIQHKSATPRAVWNPDIPSPIRFRDYWQAVPDATVYDNAFKVQWESYLTATWWKALLSRTTWRPARAACSFPKPQSSHGEALLG